MPDNAKTLSLNYVWSMQSTNAKIIKSWIIWIGPQAPPPEYTPSGGYRSSAAGGLREMALLAPVGCPAISVDRLKSAQNR